MKPTADVAKLTGGRTTRALAAKIGCDHSYVAHILRGTRTPSVPMLERMAKVLRVPVGELLDRLKAYAKAHNKQQMAKKRARRSYAVGV